MKVSLNWVKNYIDLPETLTADEIARDLTLRTVEVDDVEDLGKKFHDIVVGEIVQIKEHPNADALRICMVDIGEGAPRQIVCGGRNLYVGEHVVVSKPGSEVVWHGEGEPVVLEETKVRGEYSYGMICGATEVYLDKLFPPADEHEIVDLKGLGKPGENIADVVYMNDVVIEIDNKSLTNRPDMWGHYGIARELAAIYHLPLKELPVAHMDPDLPVYDVTIEEPEKCNRYMGVEIEGVCEKEAPLWMKAAVTKAGMRPISRIVDITNYVMLAVGQPTHAFDRTHVEGEKIIVRNAKEGEELLLLDNNSIELTTDDLVICDEHDAMALAGIRGGKKDSILPETTGVLLEIADFTAPTIRKTGRRFDEKTDASIRYEKGIDTQRAEQGLAVSLQLFKELFPESKVVAYADVYPVKTEKVRLDVTQAFMDERLGEAIPQDVVERILTDLGFEVEYEDGVYHTAAPTWRSTGDIVMKDDVMGEVARILSYDSFSTAPLTIHFDKAVHQTEELLERKLREYLAFRCGFNEIFTYPWIDERYIKAARIDTSESLRLTAPPAPELAILRSSLIPGMLEAVAKNLRYFDEFRIFEVAQAFVKGEYHQSDDEEVLPVHKKFLTGAVVGKDAAGIFYEMKGAVEAMAEYTHMEPLTFTSEEKPTWADPSAWLNIVQNGRVVGRMGLVSVATMTDSRIRRTNVAAFEINTDLLIPFASRTNVFTHLPQFPLVEKDLSVLVDEDARWANIAGAVANRVKEVEFIGEYRGAQVPRGKKSVTLRVKIGKDNGTLTTEEINKEMDGILRALQYRAGAVLREE